jgi:outer membrane receptor protein involved in Fe transport
MKIFQRFIVPILLLIVIAAPAVWSGTTGKVAGIITDKASGEPLPAANVVIVGTMLGAATDMNGEFTILEVTPGNYSVQVSYVGYGTVTVSDVRVYIDQTARVDVVLETQAYEASATVVWAERTKIRKDVATSVIAIDNKEIEALPINNVVSAIGLQAGIRGGWQASLGYATQPDFISNYKRGNISVNDGPSIRGGGAESVLFMVDGFTMRDPRNNEPMTKIALSSVKEISVERGGFNAEYGQVRSGIVNVVSQEGNKQGYSGSMQFRLSPPAAKYWRGKGILDVQDPYSYALRPFFDPAVCWTGTANGAWDKYTLDQYPEFKGWNKISQELCTDNDPNNDLTPVGAQRVFMYETRKKQINDQPDWDIDAGFGGPLPFISKSLGNLRFFTSFRSTRDVLIFPLTRPDYRDFTWSGQLISDITPTIKLRVSGIIGKQYTIRHNWDVTNYNQVGGYFYPHYPNEIAGVASGIATSADLPGLFSNFNFCLADIGQKSIAAKLTHTFSPKTFYEVSLEYLRRDYFTRPTALRDTSLKYEIIPGYITDSNPFGYWPFGTNGVLLSGTMMHVSKARDNTVVSSATFKADFTSQINFQNLMKVGIEFNYFDLDFDYGTVTSGGIGGPTPVSWVNMEVKPLQGAIYIQDKLETKGFTLNAGLRLDYNNANFDWWNVDPYNAAFFSNEYSRTIMFAKTNAKADWQLSPRLGIAHPITENSKLFFNYGHFKQVPQYESLFRVERSTQGQMVSYGNPNLVMAKTTSYELGYDHVLFETFMLQLAAFYNDITDQQDMTLYDATTFGFSYTQSTANNYQDIRGFEVTLRKTRGRWWSGFANYTYQVSTSGHFGSSRKYNDPGLQKKWNEATVNLYQDRPIPQPYARANLNLYTPDDFGPKVWGHNIFGGFLANAVVDWQGGYWTTWNPSGAASVAYNVKAVDFFNATLRMEKAVDVKKFRVQFFMDISNVFNTLRLWNTGDKSYMASLHLPKSEDYGNIPGHDKVGDYRKPGVEYQPMEIRALIDRGEAGLERPIYYESKTGTYWQYMDNQNLPVYQRWSRVSDTRIKQVLKDKAYIDMPNASTFWFLNPRDIFFGVRVSFNFGQ